MIIRTAKIEDIDAIITVLQASLGESLLKKSDEIWNFKHVDNPFGSSTVLVAEENAQLIGVRAFMQWRWQLGQDVWISYRAVDTATHPDHQGKGIFKKLTLQALDEIQKKSDCFVFNTPNDQSRPGYLKMGWQEVGKIKVALIPTFFYALPFLFFKKNIENSLTPAQLETLCEIQRQNLAAKNVIFTPKSTQYLKWRYEENPLQRYSVHSTADFYVVMYIKKHRFFNELRVVEVLSNDNSNSAIRKIIVNNALKNNCWLITIADKSLFNIRFYGNFGPKLTFKPLTTSTQFINKATEIKNWYYSLGDLELF